jgi:hypothetical protein
MPCAPRGNFGLIWVQGKGIGFPAYAAWTRASARRWSELATRLREETGIDVALEQRGGVHLCLSERELAMRNALAARDAASNDIEMLDGHALMKLLPGIGPDVAGGSYCAADGHVNPLRLLRELHAAFVGRGGSIVSECAVRHGRAKAAALSCRPRRGRLARSVSCSLPASATRRWRHNWIVRAVRARSAADHRAERLAADAAAALKHSVRLTLGRSWPAIRRRRRRARIHRPVCCPDRRARVRAFPRLAEARRGALLGGAARFRRTSIRSTSSRAPRRALVATECQRSTLAAARSTSRRKSRPERSSPHSSRSRPIAFDVTRLA